MQDPLSFYSNKLKNEEQTYTSLRKKSLIFAMIRLGLFLLAIVPFFVINEFQVVKIFIVLTCIVLFLFVVSINSDVNHLKKRSQYKIQLLKFEIAGIQGDFTKFYGGEKYAESNHFFAHDLDLFGESSFFQSINRTSSNEGEKCLAEMLKSNDTSDIIEKQKSVEEISTKPDFCLEFRTTLNTVENSFSHDEVSSFLNSYHSKLPKFMTRFALIHSAVSVVLIALVFLSIIEWQIIMFPFFGGLLFTGLYLKKIMSISKIATKLDNSFKSYSHGLNEIEKENWESSLIKKSLSDIKESDSISVQMHRFSKIMSALDQGNNIFFAIIGNGLFLWNLRHASKAEIWIVKNKIYIHKALDTLKIFDAFISLGMYKFNHPTFNFPIIKSDLECVIDTSELAHPLINNAKAIRNNIAIGSDDFLVITGANMAGKSTFLRSIGISIIMANNGLPVNAKEFNYSPISLISSMRSSDNLSKDESYFFAELKRLKFIVDNIQNKKYFIILDEILKGTNSKDKEIGSKKFLIKLSSHNCCGLIATHDLSLCQVADENKNVHNYYFDAIIENDNLHFDYKLKRGICQNMNASFLLQKMEIV